MREPVFGDDVMHKGLPAKVSRSNGDGRVDLAVSDPTGAYSATIVRQVPYDASGTIEFSWCWPEGYVED